MLQTDAAEIDALYQPAREQCGHGLSRLQPGFGAEEERLERHHRERKV